MARFDTLFRIYRVALLLVATAVLAYGFYGRQQDGPPQPETGFCVPYLVRGDSALPAAWAKRRRGRRADHPVYVGHLVALDRSFRCFALVLEGKMPGQMDGSYRVLRADGSVGVGSSHDLVRDHGRLAVRDSLRLGPDLAACRVRFEGPDSARYRPKTLSICPNPDP